MPRFVLSPFVETTAASAWSLPARSSTEASMPCPTTNPPFQTGPRRASAHSLSPTAGTAPPDPSLPAGAEAGERVLPLVDGGDLPAGGEEILRDRGADATASDDDGL